MPKLLAVCHSVGDTQVIFQSARELAKDNVATDILIVGSAAKNQAIKLSDQLSPSEKCLISFINLDKFLPDAEPIRKNSLALNGSDIDTLTEELKVQQNYSALLVGTPSYTDVKEQCDIPDQLLSKWAPLIHSAVVSDYAFYDPNHKLSTHRWFEKAKKFLLPFAKAKELFTVSDEKTEIVGHPSIDTTKALFEKWEQDKLNDPFQRISETRNKLGISVDQKFIFVACGKAGDEAMIRALAQTCSRHPNIQIVLGMHPFADPTYTSAIKKIIEDHQAENKIKFAPKNFSTDEAVFAANGIMTVSSTVGTTSGACGKVVAFYQEGKSIQDKSVPYAVSEYDDCLFCSSEKDLLPYYKRVANTPNAKDSKSSFQPAVYETASEKIAKVVKSLFPSVS